MKRYRSCGRAGFTLIEVLVALSILGVTMTTTVTLFSTGMKLRRASTEHLAFQRDARRLIRAMTDDFAHLVADGPAPMVTADSIVLWRSAVARPGEQGALPLTQLVTYQWSVRDGEVASQDSLLVRVVSPLACDATGFEEVRDQCMRWARVARTSDVRVPPLLREAGGARFGARAVLNGLGGSWVAYPHVRAFDFDVSEDADESLVRSARSRIRIVLAPRPCLACAQVHDPIARRALLRSDRSRLEAALWLPIAAQVPVAREDEVPWEVQS